MAVAEKDWLSNGYGQTWAVFVTSSVAVASMHLSHAWRLP
jgi:hypothetical protein